MINNYFPGYTGQQEYQAYVDQDEEERRRREQEMAMPVKQTIETDPVTGAQKVRIEGSAYNLSAANPLTPTVSAPVSPEQLSQLQSQTVAAQPVAQVQAPPPEPIPPQPQIPPAPQMQQAPAPQMQQAPAAPISPAQSAQMQQQATTPPAAVQMQQQPAPAPAPAAVQMPPTGVGPSSEGTAGEAQAQSSLQRQQQAFLAAQGDPTRLTMLAQTETIHPMIKTMAQDRLADMYSQQRAEQQARQDLATKSPTEIARMMQARDQEGSWGRAILFGLLGMENAAKDESAKLGIGARWSTQDMNGQPVMIKMRADGVPMEGYNAATGERLSTQELTAAAGNVGQKLGIVGGTYVNDRTGEVGRVVTDEKTGRTWVQTDSGRKSMAGFRPQASAGTLEQQLATQQQRKGVDLQYAAPTAAATAGGKIAGETAATYGTPIQQPQQLPVGAATGVPAPQAPAAPGTVTDQQRAQADVTALQREIARIPQNDSRREILLPELARAQARAGGAVAPVAPSALPAVGPAPTPAQLQTNQALTEAQGRENIQVAGARSQSFNKILDEEVRPQAQEGDKVVGARKSQFEIFSRPGVDANKIFGLYNAAGEGKGAQGASIIRDIIGGQFRPEAEVSQRLAQLNLTPQEKSALAEYNMLNQRINAATLKQNSGAGSVSDAEQRANKESNVDPTKIPALGAYNGMAQSQFSGDLARYKGDWATTSRATNALELDREWRREQSRLTEMYRDIARQRATYISQQGATTQAVQQGYQRFPVPEYSPERGTWIKTRPLESFNR
jgi:hypothetical protein